MPDAGGKLSIEELYERVRPAVVVVKPGQGLGSGFFVADGSVVATNAHVVGYSRNVKIKTSVGTEVACPVLRSFHEDDIAFIHFAPKGQVQPMRGSDTLKVGQSVMALGNPMGMEYSITRGIVSALNQTLQGRKFIQSDAATSPGSSGGPLFDEFAMVVGLNAMIVGPTISLAIPAELVHERLKGVVDAWSQISATRYCPICGARSAHPRYCETCGIERSSAEETAKSVEGAPQEPGAKAVAVARSGPAACPACQTQVPAGVRYCGKCGSEVAS